MTKIAILTDSGCGITTSEAQTQGIFVIPLLVLIGNDTYHDGVDLQTQDVYQALRDGKYPKTSTPLYQSIEDMLSQIKEQGYTDVLAIPLSAGLSSTHQSIRLAAEEVGIPTTVIDVYSTCLIQKHVAIKAKQLADQGLSIREIVDRLDRIITTSNTLILPDDLDHLAKGGRLTPLAASLANLLKIKPVLQLNKSTHGKIDVFAKIRTERKALEHSIETLHDTFEGKKVAIYIIHSAAGDRTQDAKRLLIEKGYDPNAIVVHDIAAVIASHTGLNCLGIQFIEEL